MSAAPEIVTLTDAESGGSARILISQGFNCFSWCLGRSHEGREVLWASADHASGQARASSSGIPLLFPFPGRLSGTQLKWRGRTFQLEEGDGRGNAIHGFLHTRPWKLLEQSPSRVTAEFVASQVDPSLRDCWPSDFRVVATYELEGDELRYEMSVSNVGDEDLPFGFGVHPYFRVDAESVGAGVVAIRVPVDRDWVLDEMLPTGEVQADPFGLAEGASLKGLSLDHVFEHAASSEAAGGWTASVESGGRVDLRMRYGAEYPFCVVYTPGHGEAVCIEPYTCLPTGLSQGEGDESLPNGWRLLEPGETFTTEIVYCG